MQNSDQQGPEFLADQTTSRESGQFAAPRADPENVGGEG